MNTKSVIMALFGPLFIYGCCIELGPKHDPIPPFMSYQELKPKYAYIQAVTVGTLFNDGLDSIACITGYARSAGNHDYKLIIYKQSQNSEIQFYQEIQTKGTYVNDPSSIAIADIDNDNNQEIIVAHSNACVEIFHINDSSLFESSYTISTKDSYALATGDFNSDGQTDLASIGFGTDTLSVWFQNSEHRIDAKPLMIDVTHGGFDALAKGDINDDGMDDIIVMSGQEILPNIGVLLQTKAGYGEPIYCSVGDRILTHGLAVGDITNSGKDSIVVSYGGNSPFSRIAVFTSGSDGTVSTEPSVIYNSIDIPCALSIADINHDGRLDIVVNHAGWNNYGVYTQTSTGVLDEEINTQIPYYGSPINQETGFQCIAPGDFSKSGIKSDIIVVSDVGLAIMRKN